MRYTPQKNQFAEILVKRDNHSLLFKCKRQNGFIRRTRGSFSNGTDIISEFVQHLMYAA